MQKEAHKAEKKNTKRKKNGTQTSKNCNTPCWRQAPSDPH